MKIKKILSQINSRTDCELFVSKKEDQHKNLKLPKDLEYFYNHYNGLRLYANSPYAIEIVGIDSLVPINNYLYPKDDVIWEELEGDISQNWFLIAKSEELSQYISIDLSEERMGFCYDSFIEIHANPGSSLIIAKSFTELLENLLRANGKGWYWLDEGFKGYGDAYDD